MPAANDSLSLHVRSYRSALKSTHQIALTSLENSHIKLNSILHPLAGDSTRLDAAALTYALLRLPTHIDRCRLVVAAPTPEVFAAAGFADITAYPRVTTVSRRRTLYYLRPQKTLAAFIASISDIDDLTNILLAYQIEWNKAHTLLTTAFTRFGDINFTKNSSAFLTALQISELDWHNLQTALGPKWRLRLQAMFHQSQNLHLQLLAGSWVDYTKATQRWWKNIALTTAPVFHISHQTIYFVSSNEHSLYNIFTGLPVKSKKLILDHLHTDHPDLAAIDDQITASKHWLSPKDFLYYSSRHLLTHPDYLAAQKRLDRQLNILTVPNPHYLNVTTQLFPLKSLLKAKYRDPSLKITRPQKIAASDALIFNIEYPLGFAAYHILTEIMANVARVKGVYILGKAAVLNAEIGDIHIPRLVFDEHTQNSYIFNNCFNKFFPFVANKSSVLTQQKAVSVLGTYLETPESLELYSQNNLTIIEMESGPYLGAITEATYDQSLPKGTIVDLNTAPFDVGIINYASDTPYSQTKNLGSRQLSLDGIEPTYLSTLTILQRIIDLEEAS